MSTVLYIIAGLVGVGAAWFGFYKLFSYTNKKKKERIFRFEVLTIVEELCVHFNSSHGSLTGIVEANLNKCTRWKDVKIDERLSDAYRDGDYILFAYLSLMEYAEQYDPTDPERIAIEEYCGPHIRHHRVKHLVWGLSRSESHTDSYSEISVFCKAFLATIILVGIVGRIMTGSWVFGGDE